MYPNLKEFNSFSTFILSKLVEDNKTCAFPYYYGSLVGIKKKFYYNITEEYDSIKRTDWFYNGLNKNYNIHCVNKYMDDDDKYDKYDSDEYDSEDYPIVNVKYINGDEYTNNPLLVDNKDFELDPYSTYME